MNPSDISQLYEYLIESRQGFLAKFRELGWNEINRNYEASQHSMHGIFIHMLEVEDSWLHCDIPGKSWPHGDRDPSAFKRFEETEAYDREIAEKTRRLIRDLTANSLGKEVRYESSRGMMKGTVEHILIHAFLDEVAHIGELVCLMWQLNIEPPLCWVAQPAPDIDRRHVLDFEFNADGSLD